MKNKLILTALAAAIVAPGVASATDVTIGGIVEVYLKQSDNGGDVDDTTTVEADDVRIAIKAEETKGDYTGYASYRIDSDALSNEDNPTVEIDVDDDNEADYEIESKKALTADSIAVGIKGPFGDFTMGEVTSTQHGQFANDIYDYLGDTEAHLGYKNTFGPVALALAWSPEDSDDHIGLGVEGTFGPVTVGAATNSFGDHGADDDSDYNSTILGAKAGLGPVNLAAHAYDKGDEEVTGFALQANGDVAAWSWKVTYATEEYEGIEAKKTEVDDISKTTTRLDIGTSLMDVVGFSIRYNVEDDDANEDTTSFIRAGLTMEF